MVALKLKKVYSKYYPPSDPYRYEIDGESMGTIGVVEHLCENQKFDKLDEDEQIVVTVEKIPFVLFRIILSPEKKYHLMSFSPISLRTYLEQAYRVERWGDYDEVGYAVNKVISVVAGFINRMGKEETNDGNYYKEEDDGKS